MQQYQVPQFIDVEDKIFGPLTMKQFIYLLVGGGILFILYRILPPLVFFVIALPLAAVSFSLAFVKVNGRPFIHSLLAGIRYYAGSTLYLWKQAPKQATARPEEAKQNSDLLEKLAGPERLNDSKLKELAWNLDIHKRNQKNG